VVDTGVVKEKQFDPLKNVSSLRLQPISQSSAQQRAGRAGRTEPGTCLRLYSSAAFSRMRPNTVPEIKRLQLGQTVLKLLSLGIGNPVAFDYIETPGRENIVSALRQLAILEAVVVDDEQMTAASYQLTALGAQMARLPLDPRLAKFVLLACAKGVGSDALIVAALAATTRSVFFRMGSAEEVQAADQLKIQFCSELGDFITLLELFKCWQQVAEGVKSRWCVTNSVNAKSMRVARDALRDLKSALTHDVGLKLQERRTSSSEEEDHLLLSEILFSCFRDNLCVYSGHPRTGYINLRTRDACRLHPSTCLLYLGNVAPRLIVYDQILNTSAAFLLTVSTVRAEWLTEAEGAVVTGLAEDLVTQAVLGPLGPRVLKQSILGAKWVLLRQLEADIRHSVADPDLNPDPPDPHVFGPSGSTSQRYGSGSFSHHAKKKKNRDFYYFVTLFDFLSLENDVNVPSKSNKQKKLCLKISFLLAS
jgi:ATP-dependent RNA helicase DHX8/PRP22